MVKLLRELAPAKINLFLRITGRRPDGYHELDSIFLPVAIHDQIDIELRPSSSVSVQLFCDSDTVPRDERNLAFRAAREFLAQVGIQAEVLIRLHKNIPVGAGMGGGSSDAGGVLRMLAKLCRIDNAEVLQTIAAGIGADVPFFLNPVPSRVRGIGERCEALGRIEKLFLLIAVPPIEVSTAVVFRESRLANWSGPATDSDVRAIIEGQILRDHILNDLEQVAISKWPIIGQLKELVTAVGARAAAMTGSGGAVFGIFDSSEEASEASCEIIRRAPGVQAFATSWPRA